MALSICTINGFFSTMNYKYKKSNHNIHVQRKDIFPQRTTKA